MRCSYTGTSYYNFVDWLTENQLSELAARWTAYSPNEKEVHLSTPRNCLLYLYKPFISDLKRILQSNQKGMISSMAALKYLEDTWGVEESEFGFQLPKKIDESSIQLLGSTNAQETNLHKDSILSSWVNPSEKYYDIIQEDFENLTIPTPPIFYAKINLSASDNELLRSFALWKANLSSRLSCKTAIIAEKKKAGRPKKTNTPQNKSSITLVKSSSPDLATPNLPEILVLLDFSCSEKIFRERIKEIRFKLNTKLNKITPDKGRPKNLIEIKEYYFELLLRLQLNHSPTKIYNELLQNGVAISLKGFETECRKLIKLVEPKRINQQK